MMQSPVMDVPMGLRFGPRVRGTKVLGRRVLCMHDISSARNTLAQIRTSVGAPSEARLTIYKKFPLCDDTDADPQPEAGNQTVQEKDGEEGADEGSESEEQDEPESDEDGGFDLEDYVTAILSNEAKFYSQVDKPWFGVANGNGRINFDVSWAATAAACSTPAASVAGAQTPIRQGKASKLDIVVETLMHEKAKAAIKKFMPRDRASGLWVTVSSEDFWPLLMQLAVGFVFEGLSTGLPFDGVPSGIPPSDKQVKACISKKLTTHNSDKNNSNKSFGDKDAFWVLWHTSYDLWAADIGPFYNNRVAQPDKAPPKYASLLTFAEQGFKPRKSKKDKRPKVQDKENEDPFTEEQVAADEALRSEMAAAEAEEHVDFNGQAAASGSAGTGRGGASKRTRTNPQAGSSKKGKGGTGSKKGRSKGR